MSRNGKVIVAMSGGVDSSVAACLLKEQGYDCIGVFMRVGAAAEEPEVCQVPADGAAGLTGATSSTPPRRNLKHGCCSATDAMDARVIAGRLGVPFYALNFRADFEQIIDYFVDEYGHGRTPNPCVQCNIHLKFGKLLRYADAMDAEFVATGHYARVFREDGVAPRLARGVNLAKDQSYVLFGIRRDDIGRCLFPIGDFPDKGVVRGIAENLGLRVHDKPDSQEICFVPENDYRRLLAQREPELLTQPGVIQDQTGRQVGEHTGVAGFTIGQRRGLGIAVGLPIYVTRIDAETNTVTVGGRQDLDAPGLIADRMNWLVDAPPIDEPRSVYAKIRHMHTPAAATLTRRANETVEVRFETPQSAVTPGQAAVFYDADVVLGGGWIDRAAD
jgi:tRNA-uridine 2-sulfurtransferase